MLGPQRLESAVDLDSDERGVLEQPADFAPDERFEFVGADRSAVADAPADVAPVVLADAAVVDDLLLAGAGGGAVAGVAALAADDQALQRAGLARVALGELGVAHKALLRERERLVADQRRDRDEQPLLDRLVDAHLSAAVAFAALTGRARRLAVAVLDLGLAVGGLAAVGGVAQHPPHRRAVPHLLALAGRDSLLGQPARELRDRAVPLGVAAEDLAHDLRLAIHDFPIAIGDLGLADEPVAVRGTGHHRLVAGARTVQLPAPGALADLRALVLGDHPLKLSEQLVLGRARPLAATREHDLDTGPGELLEQQHLVGVAAREPIRRVAQQHLKRALGGTVAQPLERRPDQRRAGEPLIAEHQLLGDRQATLGRELTQPGELTEDRPLLALTLRGHPRVR
jgi:hypothetical protein